MYISEKFFCILSFNVRNELITLCWKAKLSTEGSVFDLKTNLVTDWLKRSSEKEVKLFESNGEPPSAPEEPPPEHDLHPAAAQSVVPSALPEVPPEVSSLIDF